MLKAKVLMPILAVFWCMGLLMAGGLIDSELPGKYQHLSCIMGVVIFALSNIGIAIIGRNNHGSSRKNSAGN